MNQEVEAIREQLKTGNLLMCEAVRRRGGYPVDLRIVAKRTMVRPQLLADIAENSGELSE